MNDEVEVYFYMDGFREWVDLTYRGITLSCDKREYDELAGWTDKEIFFYLYDQQTNSDEGLYHECEWVPEKVCDEVYDEWVEWEYPTTTNMSLDDKYIDFDERVTEIKIKYGMGYIDGELALKAFFGDCADNFRSEYGPCDWNDFEEMLDEALNMSDEKFYNILKQAEEEEWD